MRSRGFTLLEVMIACAIVAILAAIAYPSYINSIQKSRRAEAKAALLGVASQMERFSTEKGTYATATLGTGVNAVYPNHTESSYYNLSLAPLTATTYTARAAPTGAQTADPCGTLTYNEQGVKAVTGGSWTTTQCW
ncbi:MAG TPA: type IV pilin protein [Casimicrobiaceae bacterium]|nr:type IV pilin protein [Casimicrobiaceae bacterium]